MRGGAWARCTRRRPTSIRAARAATLQMGLYDDDLDARLRRMVARSTATAASHRARAATTAAASSARRSAGCESRAPSVVPYAGAGGSSPRALSRDEIARDRRTLRRCRRPRRGGGLRLRRHPRRARLPAEPVLVAPCATSATTNTAAISRAACGFRWKSCAPSARRSARTCRSSTGSAATSTRTTASSLADVCAIAPHLAPRASTSSTSRPGCTRPTGGSRSRWRCRRACSRRSRARCASTSTFPSASPAASPTPASPNT